jgi:hypothetical protein
MISTELFSTGAAGAAPLPAVVCPSRPTGAVALAPTAAPLQGTGLPIGARSVARPWAPSVADVRFAGAQRTDAFGDAARPAGDAERTTTSSTPGAQPPRAPLS